MTDKSLFATCWEIISISVPSMVSLFVTILVEVINVSFVGRRGDAYMVAGVGMGNVFVNVLC